MIARQQTIEFDLLQPDLFSTTTLYCDRCWAIVREGSEGDSHPCHMGGRGTLFQHRIDELVVNDSAPRTAIEARVRDPLVRVLVRQSRKHHPGHYWVRQWGSVCLSGGLYAYRLDRAGRVRQQYRQRETWDFFVES